MAFNLDFGHIPGGLELPILPTSTVPLSDTTKTIVDRMTSDPGALFSNPMVSQTNILGDSIARVETHITGLSTGVFTSPSISQSEATEYLAGDPFNNVRTTMGNFLMHTGRLSGILKSQGIQAPGLQQILSIGLQMQNMLSIVGASSECLAVIGGATGLFSKDTLFSATNSVDSILSKLERGVATIANIADLMAVISNTIRGIIDKDSQFLNNCVNQLQSAGLALALEALDSNPCAHFVFDTISNTNPGGFLNIIGNKST